MPRFEVRTSAGLRDALCGLGLEPAFDPRRADFSRMSAEPGLAIFDVVHQALAVVDENGTIAAAATAVQVGVTAVPLIRSVVVDHPFMWLIRDDATGAVLFLGRFVGP